MRYEACEDCGVEKTEGRRKRQRCQSCAGKGNTNGDGKRSPETRAKISLARGGDGDILNRKFPGLNRWTRLVKERDGYKCIQCDYQGSKGDNFMEAHHVVPKIKFPELATELFNGVTYCRSCHKEIHAT